MPLCGRSVKEIILRIMMPLISVRFDEIRADIRLSIPDNWISHRRMTVAPSP
jgi:hypothetical protein